MIFSHVEIPSCRAKAHLVFHWCLYNKGSYHLRWWGDLTSFTRWHGSFDQRQARICELYQFRPLLYGETLSLVDGLIGFLVENQSTAAFFHLTRDWEFVSHWRRTACLGNKNRLCVRNQSNVKLRGLFLLETENLFPIDVGRRACLRNENCLCVGNQSNDELKEVCLC